MSELAKIFKKVEKNIAKAIDFGDEIMYNIVYFKI